jgi:competence protein ComEA
MIQSLLIKLAMLAMTMSVVFWIAWQGPQGSLKVSSNEAGPAAGLPVADIPLVRETGEADGPNEQAALLPAVAAEKSAPSPAKAPSRRTGPLDLNRASADEIDALPGIGSVLAERLIAYRTSAGGFRSIDDLRRVKGIGAKKLDRLRPLIMVSAPYTAARGEKKPL